jgi:3-oxoacyl-(acyl-carrier-protein) synthase
MVFRGDGKNSVWNAVSLITSGQARLAMTGRFDSEHL